MSKLMALTDALREELKAGTYPPGSRFPSEYRIAEKYGVNKTTANKAVSALVSEGLLSRAGRGAGTLVEQLQAFPVKQFAYIGNFRHPYYTLLLYGLQQAALAHHCLMSVVAPPPDQLSYVLSRLSTARISGFFSCGYGSVDIGSIPVIYLEENSTPPGMDSHYVACDSYRGAYQIMQELLKRNHRDIVILFRNSHAPGRLKGFYAAMQEAGIQDVRERTFWTYDSDIISSFEGQRILQKMLQQYPGLTAIVSAADDDIAKIVKAADQLGIPWRGKIAMTGFGNVAGISDLLPIATVDQHPQQIGREAFQAMQKLIADPKLTIQEHLDVELVGLDNLPVLPA